MKKSLNQVLIELRIHLPALKNHFNVSDIEPFGSYAANNHNTKSDIDILVTFTKTPRLLRFIEQENFISDHLNLKLIL